MGTHPLISTHQVTYWSIVSSVHPVLTQLREDKERIADVVVEDVGGEHYSTQVQENVVKYLKKKKINSWHSHQLF